MRQTDGRSEQTVQEATRVIKVTSIAGQQLSRTVYTVLLDPHREQRPNPRLSYLAWS
jgi:hypothetical protein